jgi:hypothetical protein
MGGILGTHSVIGAKAGCGQPVATGNRANFLYGLFSRVPAERADRLMARDPAWNSVLAAQSWKAFGGAGAQSVRGTLT